VFGEVQMDGIRNIAYKWRLLICFNVKIIYEYAIFMDFPAGEYEL